MELFHIKMKNGQDLVGSVDFIDEGSILLSNVMEFVATPNLGMYTKKWLHLSKDNETRLHTRDVLFVNPASDDAVDMYVEVLERKIQEAMEEVFEHSSTTIH